MAGLEETEFQETEADALFDELDTQTETQFIAACSSTQYDSGADSTYDPVDMDSDGNLTMAALSTIKREPLLSATNSNNLAPSKDPIPEITTIDPTSKKPRMEIIEDEVEDRRNPNAVFLSHFNQSGSSSQPQEQKIPAIIATCYEEFALVLGKRSAKCRICKEVKSDLCTSTSNFLRHTKTQHSNQYKDYKRSLTEQEEGQKSIDSFTEQPLFRRRDPRQLIIKNHIIGYIIHCAIPIATVESTSFREMISACESRFCHLGRKGARQEIGKRYNVQRIALENTLASCTSVSLTVDIWSDRRTRSFLGVTAHYLEQSTLFSSALACSRFHGRHTGQNIKEKLDEIIHRFGLEEKILFVVSDNAANMAKAFSTSFPTQISEIDGGELWADTEDIVQVCIADYSDKHLRCFAHSLQLVVNDGMAETKPLYSTLGKCSKLASSLHTSSLFKENFEKEFGPKVGISQPISVRWNSTLTHVKCVLRLDRQKLEKVCRDCEKDNLVLNVKDYANLEELVVLLEPFLEATNLCQGEKMVTVSYVIPAILMISQHLQTTTSLKVLPRMRDALKDSLTKRFLGALNSVTATGSTKEEPFGDDVYTLATVMDPQFNLRFFDYCSEPQHKARVSERIRGMVIARLDASMGGNLEMDTETQILPTAATTGLFASFERHQEGAPTALSATDELNSYVATPKAKDAMQFWNGRKVSSPQLARLAMDVLCVPASSAPVERLFSNGGLIGQAKRLSMSADLLEELVFLKCNKA